MDLLTSARRKLFSWLLLGAMALLVGVLAVLQYNWIGEVSHAEQKSLAEKLQSDLDSIRRDFDREIGGQVSALIPSEGEIADSDLATAYGRRYQRWQSSSSHKALFRRAGIAIPNEKNPPLLLWNSQTGAYEPARWPDTWQTLFEWAQRRGRGGPPDRLQLEATAFIDIPRFGPDSAPGISGEKNWLFLELDAEYAAGALLPELLARYLGSGFARQYLVGVLAGSTRLYRSSDQAAELSPDDAEASTPLLNVRTEAQGPGRGEGRGRGREGKRRPPFKDGNFPPEKGGPPPFREGNPGSRWTLLIRHRAGTLEAIVERARQRNLAVSGGVLLLLLAAAAFLLRLSRETQRLAEAQMDFVAGISHELRTPLAVIRTASYNLRGKIARNPTQVEKYGALIQDHAEKLGGIVEQVLRFASVRAGQAIHQQVPVQVDAVLRESLKGVEHLLEERACRLECDLTRGVPAILGDSAALHHAFQNLISNALKYGVEYGGWLGVSAGTMESAGHSMVEVRVSDRGPGIPAEEQKHVFDPFYRGKRAVADQVHGTGLGLSLVKKIIEAHSGTIRVESVEGQGATFIVRLPACAAQQGEELAHTLG